MRVLGYRPGNDWVQRQLDRRWRAWLSRCVAGAAVVAVTLAALVGPRQSNVRLRYEIAQVGDQVAALEREHRQLVLERETLGSPEALSRELPDLGLVGVGRDHVAYLDPGGRLVAAPVRTPAVGRPTAPRPGTR